MKYRITLQTITVEESEAKSAEEAIQEAKDKAAWDYFNDPSDWEVASIECINE